MESQGEVEEVMLYNSFDVVVEIKIAFPAYSEFVISRYPRY